VSVVEVSLEGATGVATLTMNRPARLNALGLDLLDAMIAALAALAKDPACKALVITGAGSAFCAGADLNTFAELREQKRYRDSGEQVSQTMRERFNPLMVALTTMPKPVVTAINGIAAGGGAGIALAADVVLCGASGTLKFVQAQQLGIVADLGAHWLLQRLGGRVTALGATLLGETLDAARSASLGLVWEVVPDTELLSRARATATKLARVPADVVVATRAIIDASTSVGFAELLEVERMYQRDFCSRAAFLANIETFLGQHDKPRG
jgi:2-(1,2-epoxy-1,2-dihydrophenyl)acetyl-CoA isomerase